MNLYKYLELLQCYVLYCIGVLTPSLLVQPPPGSVPSQEQQELLNAQLDRIHTLFRRQLAVPLMGESCSFSPLTPSVLHFHILSCLFLFPVLE